MQGVLIITELSQAPNWSEDLIRERERERKANGIERAGCRSMHIKHLDIC